MTSAIDRMLSTPGQGANPAPHRYDQDRTSGIGHCKVCGSDDDGNHVAAPQPDPTKRAGRPPLCTCPERGDPDWNGRHEDECPWLAWKRACPAVNPALCRRLAIDLRANKLGGELVQWIDRRYLPGDDETADRLAREIRDEIDGGRCEPLEVFESDESEIARQLTAAAELAESLDEADRAALISHHREARGLDPDPNCTGVTARWCPRCGACACGEGDNVELNDPSCPLHAPGSPHAEVTASISYVYDASKDAQDQIRAERDRAHAHEDWKGMQAERDAARSEAARLAEAFEEATCKLAVTAKENAGHDLDAARRELADARGEIDTAWAILGGSPQETLRQAAERVEVNCAERARERDAARAECERLRCLIEGYKISEVAVRDRLRVLLATEPAVSEGRCGEIHRLADRPWQVRAPTVMPAIPNLLAAARQLHALRAGLREIVGGEATSAPTRAALDARQLFDLQRMREDYRVALEEVAKQAERFPRIDKFAEARDERRRHLWLLDHLLSIFGGTQT